MKQLHKVLLFSGFLSLTSLHTTHAMDSGLPGWSKAAVAAVCAIGAYWSYSSYHEQLNIRKGIERKQHYLLAKAAYYEKIKAKPWGAYAQTVLADLDAQENRLLTELAAIINTRYSASAERLKDLIAKESTPDISSSLIRKAALYLAFRDVDWTMQKDMIQNLLRECFIDPEMVTIELNFSRILQSPMATKTAMFFVAGNFLDAPQAVFKAGALHEIMHFLHYDMVVGYALELEFLLAIPGYQTKLGEFIQFQEQRADLCAGLFDPEYARALCMHYHAMHTISSQVDGITFGSEHKAPDIRARDMDDLYKNICSYAGIEYHNPMDPSSELEAITTHTRKFLVGS